MTIWCGQIFYPLMREKVIYNQPTPRKLVESLLHSSVSENISKEDNQAKLDEINSHCSTLLNIYLPSLILGLIE